MLKAWTLVQVVRLYTTVCNKSQWIWDITSSSPRPPERLPAFGTTKRLPLARCPGPVALWTSSVLTCGQV